MGQTVGMPVRGGQVLGSVGNAGQETEMSGGNNTRATNSTQKLARYNVFDTKGL